MRFLPLLSSVALVSALFSLPLQNAIAQDDPPKARITGIVVDESGNPITDAEVRVIDSKIKPVHTDAAGRFALLLDNYTVFGERLVASDATGARMALWELESEDSTNDRIPSAEARIMLRPSLAIQVQVQDASRAPVSGAHVEALQGYQSIAATLTDAAGAATLRIPDTSYVRHIFAMKPGVGFDYMENLDAPSQWPPDPPPSRVTLTLDGVRHLQVVALGSDGKPVAGVDFVPNRVRKPGRVREIGPFLTGSLPALSRTTDINGVATFDYMPASMSEITSFDLAAGPFSQEIPALWFPDSKASKDPGPLVLTSRVRRMSFLKGKVLLPDGRPASGIGMVAQGFGYGSSVGSERMLTQKDGTFAMRVASECSYIVSVEETDWAVRSLTSVVVKEGHDRDDLQLQLIKGTLIRGTVTEAGLGKPLPGHQVCIIELGDKIDFSKLAGSEKPQWYREMRYEVAHTDHEGRYSIRLGPGTYHIGNTWVIEKTVAIQIGDEAEKIVDLLGENQ